jgi:RNA polymerase sigma-70 factor, ECF subfamily
MYTAAVRVCRSRLCAAAWPHLPQGSFRPFGPGALNAVATAVIFRRPILPVRGPHPQATIRSLVGIRNVGPSGEPMNEADCIRRAQAGDAAAARELYQRYAPRVQAVVRRLAGEDALAEDWAQEAWVRVFRALPGFRGDARFSTWLHRIAVNSALHGRRWRERRVSREVDMPEEAQHAGRTDQVVLRISLQRALDELPAGMRQILVLHDVEGYTHEEIGGLLGIAPGTSKSQLFKARARLRSTLQSSREPATEGELCRI